MEEAARKRKERLETLRKRKLGAEPETSADSQMTEIIDDDEKPVLKFRNYTPINDDVKSAARIHIATPDDIGETLERQVDRMTREVKEEEEAKRAEEVDLFNLAPKKPNWDLKRDVEKKLKKLEKKTQASIAQLIRQRLQGETDAETDLADAVNAQPKVDSGDEDSD